jgi:hypothetical protein
VTVLIGHHSPAHVTVSLPGAWPPPPGGAIVAQASKEWRSLRSLVDHDTLSDGRHTLRTTYTIVAPNRLEYSIAGGGGAAVIIGDRRWDQPPGSNRWESQPQLPVTQPVPFWVSWADARILGTVDVHGAPAWRISFFDPKTPGWYTILGCCSRRS